MECPHCGKTFKTTGNLNKHIRTAKYCQLQKMVSDSDEDLIAMRVKSERRETELLALLEEKDWEISRLKEELESVRQKDSMITDRFLQKDDEMHKMLEHKNDEISKLESRLLRHEETIADIARQPRTTTTSSSSININLPPLTNKHLEEHAQFLSMDHFKRGFQGYAEYALEFPLKGMVTCTDYSRRKVKYNNDTGDTIVDPNMKNLCTNLFRAIRSRNQDLTNEYMKAMKEKAESGEWDRNDIQDLMFEAISRNSDVVSIASGNRPEAASDFVKWVCSGLTSVDPT